MPRHASESGASTDGGWFATTHWSVVLSSGQGNSPRAAEALEKLCRTYWSPLYSFVRRQGFGPEDAQDMTQAFFAKLLEKNFWARADPQKGRFRSFLLTALSQFLADQRDRARAAKRGGGVAPISFDDRSGEEQFLAALDQRLSAEQQFDRQWASAVLEQARAKLRQECNASGKARLYDRVGLVDGRSDKALPYEVIAQELDMTVSAVKSAASRMRLRYGELVRQEVAHTVTGPHELDAEIRYLLSLIGT